MWLSKIRFQNLKSFEDSGDILLSRGINLLVGPNNAGKTTILRSIWSLQSPDVSVSPFLTTNRRTTAKEPRAEFAFNDIGIESYTSNLRLSENPAQRVQPTIPITVAYTIVGAALTGTIRCQNGATIGWAPGTVKIEQKEPNNLIYPFFSNRITGGLDETINSELIDSVQEPFQHIYAKIDALLARDHAAEPDFRKIVKAVMGFDFAMRSSPQGKSAGLALNTRELIPLKNMGDGTKNLIWFLVRLCPAQQRVFIIDEIENDIHPKALKRLLEYILDKSADNQFIIATHNNIVLKYLGSAANTKILEAKMEITNGIPTSTVAVIDNSPVARLALLQRLGYDLFDFDLWEGYLLLEESSAESIINHILIPHFCPSLVGKLRTIAAFSFVDVKARLSDFMRLFTFIHTAEPYKNRAWVFIDGGETEQGIITELRSKYKTWDAQRFRNFSKHNFELYYPNEFQQTANEILLISDDSQKRKRKRELLLTVLKWANEQPEFAKAEFKKSAAEVIEMLNEIQLVLNQS